MYGINLSYPGPDSGPAPDYLDTIEDALSIQAHSLSFWDADTAELVGGADPDDPWAHPSWDVHEALTEDGWDDPAVAVEVRALLADEVRVMALAETPTVRPLVRPVDAVLADRSPSPEEELHTRLVALAAVERLALRECGRAAA